MFTQQVEEMDYADALTDRAAYYREAGYGDQRSRADLDAEMADREAELDRLYGPATMVERTCELCGQIYVGSTGFPGQRECADCWLPF